MNQSTTKNLRHRETPSVHTTRRDPLQGRIVLSRYRLTAPIDRGGMGSVYLGRDVEDGARVAVKVLRDDLVQDNVLRWRFLNESLAAQRIDHPAVIKVLDVGEIGDGRICLVMEYVDGTTLRRIMCDIPLSEQRTVPLANAVAQGLAAAHSNDVIHRDLKPENVLVPYGSKDNTLVKLVDFGLARIIDTPSITTTQQVMGTPQYISPEQATGAPIDHRVDIYALGVMMYEMLTGVLPFAFENLEELLRAHVRQPPRPFADCGLGQAVSSDLEDLVMRCLAKSPHDRPANMGHVVESLSSLQSLQPPSNPPCPGGLG